MLRARAPIPHHVRPIPMELTQGRGHRDKPVRFGREVSDGKGISSDTAPIQPRVQA